MSKNIQDEVFEAFKKFINNQLIGYFNQLGFETEIPFIKEAQSIRKEFSNRFNKVSLSISFHHLDYKDGINVVLTNKLGVKYLHSEVQKQTNNQVQVYSYWVDKIENEITRILFDFKQHLEKYLIDEK